MYFDDFDEYSRVFLLSNSNGLIFDSSGILNGAHTQSLYIHVFGFLPACHVNNNASSYIAIPISKIPFTCMCDTLITVIEF